MNTPKNCFKHKGEVMRKWYKRYDKDYGPFFIYFLHVVNQDHSIIVTTNSSRYGLGAAIDKVAEGDEVTVEFQASTREYNDNLFMDLKLIGVVNHSEGIKQLAAFEAEKKEAAIPLPIKEQIENRFDMLDDGEPVSDETEEFFKSVEEDAKAAKAVQNLEDDDDGLPF